jgi:hypothetical protein
VTLPTSPQSTRRPWSRWPPVIPEPSGPAPVEDPPHRPRSTLRELPILLLVAFLIAFVVKSLVAQAFFIPSASMENTLREGDRVLVSRLSYRLHEPRRGDIVVFSSPYEKEKDKPALVVRIGRSVQCRVGIRSTEPSPATGSWIRTPDGR